MKFFEDEGGMAMYLKIKLSVSKAFVIALVRKKSCVHSQTIVILSFYENIFLPVPVGTSEEVSER